MERIERERRLSRDRGEVSEKKKKDKREDTEIRKYE